MNVAKPSNGFNGFSRLCVVDGEVIGAKWTK